MRLTLVFLVMAALPAQADLFGFGMPSGYIECTVGLEHGFSGISCVIFERCGPPARPRPAGCPGSWGHRFSMTRDGPVEMACGGLGRRAGWDEVAPYGETGRWEGITCTSSRQGLDCRNRAGHGFFLSRARQTVR